MNKLWTATILLVLCLTATGGALAGGVPTAAMEGFATPAISSPAPTPPVSGALEPPPPIFAAGTNCYSTYQACLAACVDDTHCANKCRCQYLDCIGSEAPCFE